MQTKTRLAYNPDIDENYFVPAITATGCEYPMKVKDVDFAIRCGKCYNCLKSRRNEWSLRLEHEYQGSDSAFFITLTYNDISLMYSNTGKPTISKRDIQLYIKRLRNSHVAYVARELGIKKSQAKNHSKPIRYFAVGEYGSKTHRPHYHLLVFNMDIGNQQAFEKAWRGPKTNISYGHVDVGTITSASIQYVTKYMFKPFGKTDDRQKPFTLMSKKPIIGHNYLAKYGTEHIETEDLAIADNNGRLRRMPRIYLRKLFTNAEDRLEVSKRSYEKHLKKMRLKEKYRKTISNYIDGNPVDLAQSKKMDFQRKIDEIINKEVI